MQQDTREFSNKRESFPPALSCPNAVKGRIFFVKIVCSWFFLVYLDLWCIFFNLFIIFFSSRCCVSDRIPVSYLEQVRDKYLNYDTRDQRKDFLLNCKDPRSRLARALFGILLSACYY